MSTNHIPLPSFGQFLALHAQRVKKDDLRLGQRFVNMYFKPSWTNDFATRLFYVQDTAIAREMIIFWLLDNHYILGLPTEYTPSSSIG